MRKVISILLLFLFLISYLFAQVKKEVTIKVIAHNLPDSSEIYIAGNNIVLGNWDPGKIKLTVSNDTTWEQIFHFSKGEELEFKITRGLWSKERLNDDETVPGNTFLTVNNDTTIIFIVNKWSDQFKREVVVHGQITGRVEYIKGIEGDSLLPRDVIIWLPPGYNENKNERYPVLYMQDGQNIIDPATSSFGYDWRVDEVADSLIKAGKIHKIIIVGIYSTPDRGLEYGGSKSDSYMNFVVNKLKPIIDKEFRTKSDAKNTAVAGSSLGGTISFRLAWKYPEIFSEAACVSPAFYIDIYNCLKLVKATVGKKPVRLYIDIGGIGLEEKLQPGVDSMLVLLKGVGYKEGKDLEYFKDQNAEHNEQCWAQRVWRQLEFLFPK
ncbi:MAG: alpha/beta hydrolase-fold protein [Ignavibacteriaceae bacterium]